MKNAHTQYLYDAIAQLRKQRNLTQRDVAARLNLPQSYISKSETGQIDMGLANYLDLVRYLGADLIIVPNSLVPVVKSLLAPKSVAESDSQRPRWAVDDDDE